MEEPTTGPRPLEDMPPSLSPNLLRGTGNARVDIWNEFQLVADDHDREFTKKYDKDLNNTILFATLFSAVTSVFIVDLQKRLEPDYQEMNHTLLKIIAGVDTPLPQWNGPDSTTVHVQAALYTSLLVSILAAFIATLGKQWLNRYTSKGRGSIIDRGRNRKLKMDGMVTWRLDLVMESSALMLQGCLFFLGYALSNYLFVINKAVASVVIGFTSLGVIFYILITFAATYSYNCPFQTPFSRTFRFLIRFDDEHTRYLKRSREWFGRCLRLLGRIFSQVKKRARPQSGKHPGLGESGTIPGDQIELPMAGSDTRPLFNKETNRNGPALDMDCVLWILEMSKDVDVTMDIAGHIPEFAWDTGTWSISPKIFYDVMRSCFDHSLGYLTLKPTFRYQAYTSAKAFLHLCIQSKYVAPESEKADFEPIPRMHQSTGSERHEGDSDLESVLGVIGYVLGDPKPMDWHKFSFTIPHHCWMGHILLYRAWDVLGNDEPLPDDIRGFVLHSLQLKPPPPKPIVADCLFIIGLVLGIELHRDDLSVVDKSRECNSQIGRIHEKLIETFQDRHPTKEEIDRALEAMELIVHLPESEIMAQKSYELFHVIMQAPASLVYSQEKKWEASRLAMHGAYKWDKSLPQVGQPEDILTFLGHHFDLATSGGQDQDQAIQNALRALAYASGPDTIEALKHFDPTKPAFVRGICHAYQDDKPFQLRKAALFFLPLIGDRWFNTRDPIMESNEMRSLCVNWASAVDSIWDTCGAQERSLAVLFDMINSPHWRPHIVRDKWKLLKHFASVPDDSQPLRRCIDNPELTDAIGKVPDPDAMFHWLALLWLKYEELKPEVQERLEVVTKSRGKVDIDAYLSMMDSELEKVEKALMQYGTWSQDPVLKAKIENLQKARRFLADLRRG